MEAFLERLLRKHGWFRLHDLAVGGHCGMCGEWIPDQIFEIWWRWGACDKCTKAAEESEE